jgi:hypothetical protein
MNAIIHTLLVNGTSAAFAAFVAVKTYGTVHRLMSYLLWLMVAANVACILHAIFVGVPR